MRVHLADARKVESVPTSGQMNGDYSNNPMHGEAAEPSPLRREDEQQDLPELPPMYAVVILNDDKTPMRYVVEMLERLFHFGRRDAIAVMMAIHSRGRGRCGTYCLEVAQTKAEEVVRDARAHDHPLRCVTEKISDKKA